MSVFPAAGSKYVSVVKYSATMRLTCSLILLSLLLVASSWGAPSDDNGKDKDSDWEGFKKEHKKEYKSPEKETKARANFHATDAKIKKHNAEYNAGNVSWFMTHNQFSDMDAAEFAQVMLRPLPAANMTIPEMQIVPLIETNRSSNDRQLFAIVDYSIVRFMGVRDQGYYCGSCYTFATVGLVEWYHSLKYGGWPDFSEQQITSCSNGLGNYGCGGGYVDVSLKYVLLNGLAFESAYPYQQMSTSIVPSCKGFTRAASLSGFYAYQISQQIANDDGLLNAMRSANGPVSIHIHANDGWQSYGGAVYDCYCNGPLNHAVMIAGYGYKDGKPYWHVKNSWGTRWGANGFMYLLRGNNQCNVGSYYAWWPMIA